MLSWCCRTLVTVRATWGTIVRGLGWSVGHWTRKSAGTSDKVCLKMWLHTNVIQTNQYFNHGTFVATMNHSLNHSINLHVRGLSHCLGPTEQRVCLHPLANCAAAVGLGTAQCRSDLGCVFELYSFRHLQVRMIYCAVCARGSFFGGFVV